MLQSIGYSLCLHFKIHEQLDKKKKNYNYNILKHSFPP